jgi:O-antigen/teichoic acid export membrane protein
MLSKQILRIFSTSEIASQGFLIMPLAGLGALLLGVYVIISHILIAVRKTRVMAIIWGLAASVNLSLNILIVPQIGILGAAITTLIAYALVLVLVAYYSFKEFTFHIEWVFILKSLAASAIMSLVIWKIAPKETVTVLLTVALGIVIYVASLYLLKGFNKKEIKFFRGLFQGGILKG